MKRISAVLAVLLMAVTAPAQKNNPYKDVDARALEIPAAYTGSTKELAEYINTHFQADSDKVRAIYVWLAQNVEYDIANMFAINFYERREDKVAKLLRTRKGICEHYACTFDDVCRQCGIRSHVVTGYTKQNGFTDYIPHAWASAEVDKKWYLFDPTWGSGYVQNGKFVRKLNNDYYMVPPRRLIRSHMPFDPMWEFLAYPVTNQEFYEGNTDEDRSRGYFSYADSIDQYEKQDSVSRWVAEARRIEGNGVRNGMVFDRLVHIRRSIEEDKNKKVVMAHNAQVEEYNGAVNDFNDGVADLNAYIQYWNKQFKPARPDAEIQAMFDKGYNKVVRARQKLDNMKGADEQILALMRPMRRSVDDLMEKTEEQKDWLKRYMKQKKILRPTMFMK